MSEDNNAVADPRERAYLEKVKGKAKAELDRVNKRVLSQYLDLMSVKRYLTESKADMDHVKDLSDDACLLDPTSTTFNEGITISTAHLAKGLEFDAVILPFCDDRNYQSEVDRHMLYRWRTCAAA